MSVTVNDVLLSGYTRYPSPAASYKLDHLKRNHLLRSPAKKMAIPVSSVLWRDYVEDGKVTTNEFVLAESPRLDPAQLSDGAIFVQLLYLSVDPYMRGRMRNTTVIL